MLTNLLGHAIKFTEEGEILVSASLEGTTDGAVRVRFAVRDTGIGISAEQLSAIFREFAQADVSMTRRYGGTGLGLTISRRLVELMGGELGVTSVPGQGSEFAFSIRLPIEATTPAPAAATGAVTLGGRRILIVDDNETNRRILRDILAGEGMAVREAASAVGGIAALAEARRAGVAIELGTGSPWRATSRPTRSSPAPACWCSLPPDNAATHNAAARSAFTAISPSPPPVRICSRR